MISVCLHLPQEGVRVSLSESKKVFGFPVNSVTLRLDICKWKGSLMLIL